MKGIILAGGSGTRLYPLTIGQSKQLLAIHDKPMIYYPLSVLMLAGIRDILIISTPHDLPNFKRLLSDGSQIGMNFSYASQEKPNGIAEAFIIGEKFIGNESVCLILGDNIFYGSGFTKILKKSIESVEKNKKAKVFGYYVNNPSRYGVVQNDELGNVISLEEKPIDPKSNYAVVGLYFYPNNVVKFSKNVKPSNRGELEITSLNNFYLENKNLSVELFDKNFTWLDSGTHESMLEASNYIHTIEKRTGLKIACIEEMAYKLGYINKSKFEKLIDSIGKNKYGEYLKKILNGV
ncbi:MAG: glucose-1-phosphate thymidylyltransferase RfbA [Flavobacteriaceae bacterium]|nr:glucose-1-phosphate thymidylyltransferase RfbA [Flavobacteriaceae bacterium]